MNYEQNGNLVEINGPFRDLFNKIKDKRRAEGKGTFFNQLISKYFNNAH
jgi:hypothetical protein